MVSLNSHFAPIITKKMETHWGFPARKVKTGPPPVCFSLMSVSLKAKLALLTLQPGASFLGVSYVQLCKALCFEGPFTWCNILLLSSWNSSSFLNKGNPHFYPALGPANYVTSPVYDTLCPITIHRMWWVIFLITLYQPLCPLKPKTQNSFPQDLYVQIWKYVCLFLWL